MHHCLEVQEILTLILEFAYETAGQRKRRSAVLALALTCQAFWHVPALKLLWGRLPSLCPLIKCLHKELWEEQEIPRPSTLWGRIPEDTDEKWMKLVSTDQWHIPGIQAHVLQYV